jgi:hypothetical protein
MPSGRYPYPRPSTASRCCFASGTPAGVNGLGGTFWFASSSRHRDTPFEGMRSPAALSDTVVRETKSLVITEISDFRTTSLHGRTGRLRRTVRNPLRSDRFLSITKVACHLTAGILKLRVLSNAGSLPSDGAYPRRERRGIAPVQRINTRSTTPPRVIGLLVRFVGGLAVHRRSAGQPSDCYVLRMEHSLAPFSTIFVLYSDSVRFSLRCGATVVGVTDRLAVLAGRATIPADTEGFCHRL